MDAGAARVFAVGAWVGAAFGIAVAIWKLKAGAGITEVLLLALGSFAVVLILAAISVLGIRLQRRDLPPT